MRVLFLAPQPFFQERGTPIAVKLALEVITREFKDRSVHVDLIAYDEGVDVEIPGLVIHRIPTPFFLKGVRPGISLKKLLCDAIFAVYTLFLVIRFMNGSKETRPTIIHAVEESVFIALIIKKIFGIPYIYDMDSSLSLQLTERWWLFRPLSPLFERLERLAISNSLAVAPVCDALAVFAEKHGSHQTVMLRDVSLVEKESGAEVDLRREVGLGPDAKIVLYAGNLERYQGVDLLLESVAHIMAQVPQLHVVIIGGRPEHVSMYARKAQKLGLQGLTHFIGPRPVRLLGAYLAGADILVSPRTQGNNTPMKIYSYLHSGTPLLATKLPTHTQVLDEQISVLADPDSKSFAQALLHLIKNAELQHRIGTQARIRAEELYTPSAFAEQIIKLYGHVLKLCPGQS